MTATRTVNETKTKVDIMATTLSRADLATPLPLGSAEIYIPVNPLEPAGNAEDGAVVAEAPENILELLEKKQLTFAYDIKHNRYWAEGPSPSIGKQWVPRKFYVVRKYTPQPPNTRWIRSCLINGMPAEMYVSLEGIY